MSTTSSIAPLPPSTVVKHHTQTEEMSCAASAIEVILKAHQKIPLSDVTLQAKYGNENIGFGKPEEYHPHGINPQSKSAATDAALSEIAEETKAGRFPLISVPVHHEPGKIYFHVLVVEASPQGLRVTDPANGQFIEGTPATISAWVGFMKRLHHDAHSATLNYQTYTLQSTPEEKLK